MKFPEVKTVVSRTGTDEIGTDPMGPELSDIFISLTPQKEWRFKSKDELEEHVNKKVMDLSGGLKRRLQVAKVFMVDKPIVFLDEATTGMDPINKRAVLDAIREQANKGRTIFLTTHILQEAEELCDTIALINKGKIIAAGNVNTIKGLASNVFELSMTFESLTDDIIQELRSLSPIRFDQKGNTVEMCVNGIESVVLDMIAQVSRSSKISHFEVSSGTLEDAFVELLGNTQKAVV
jgi:ABC-2 type transport system ATP-binding protein